MPSLSGSSENISRSSLGVIVIIPASLSHQFVFVVRIAECPAAFAGALAGLPAVVKFHRGAAECAALFRVPIGVCLPPIIGGCREVAHKSPPSRLIKVMMMRVSAAIMGVSLAI